MTLLLNLQENEDERLEKLNTKPFVWPFIIIHDLVAIGIKSGEFLKRIEAKEPALFLEPTLVVENDAGPGQQINGPQFFNGIKMHE